MATSQSIVDYILDQIQSVGEVSARKMFGEYALYCDGRVVGLICDDTLFMKVTKPGKEFVGEFFQGGYAYKGAKESMLIDGDRLDDREWLCQLIQITAENVDPPKKKSNKTKL